LVLHQASLILHHCLWLSFLPTTPNKHFVAQKKVNQENLVLYQASLILHHCLWLSLLPTTPNMHFVARKEGQSRELGIIPDRALVGASCADVEL
jgi:hypothetical protein